jgi:arylsulfatase
MTTATVAIAHRRFGSEPQSLPTAHGFDEFYGIPPDMTWVLPFAWASTSAT